jgi:hypothetical protein
VTVRQASWQAPARQSQVTEAFSSVLQQLHELKQLQLLEGFHQADPAAALAPLSTMQHLQRVALSRDSCRAAPWQTCPALASLTYLQLDKGEVDEYARLSVRALYLPQLPVLQELHLGRIALEQSGLGHCTGLHTLTLDGVVLLSADDEYNEDDERFNPSGGTRESLTKLGKLTQLQVRTLCSGIGLAAGTMGWL